MPGTSTENGLPKCEADDLPGVNDLRKCEANYAPLTPITFLQRAAYIFPNRVSVFYGERHYTWSQTLDRCLRVASSLASHGLKPGDTVSVVAPNIPAMYEMNFAVPMAGCVLNALNYRMDARTIAVLSSHSEAKMVFVDTQFLSVVHEALSVHFPPKSKKPLLVHIKDEAYDNYNNIATRKEFQNLGDYEDFVHGGDPNFPIVWPKDEWDAISLNYTSGTTAAPKGVVYHHRGAYLNSIVSVLDWGMKRGAVYYWSLPMFHCNGWCYTWAVAAQCGTNVCLRGVTAKGIFNAIAEHGVTHLAGAPPVLNMIANAEAHERKPLPQQVAVLTGGAPPSEVIIAKMQNLGFAVTHGYGLTETYGPSLMCTWKEEWDALPLNGRAQKMSRQGVGTVTVPTFEVVDPKTMTPVPRDGTTMGEVVLRGHAVMKGYLKAPEETEEAFKGGQFHTGDLAVMHPDGYVHLKDRSKDVIISGGENISSVEVETILYKLPHVLEAAVVARPDNFWGETPCAFVELKPFAEGLEVSEQNIIDWCKENMPRFMVPRSVVFGDLPKTITGKVQKNILRDEAKKLGSLTPSQTRIKPPKIAP